MYGTYVKARGLDSCASCKTAGQIRHPKFDQSWFSKETRGTTLKKVDIDHTKGLEEGPRSKRRTEKLHWINEADWYQRAKWRITNFLNYAYNVLDDSPILKPTYKA